MKNKILSKGFTLIELLVVIAIIGVLASVVLASLSTSRNKSNDTSVKQNMTSIRTQADLSYAFNLNCYGDGPTSPACAAAAVAPGPCATSGVGFTDTIFGHEKIAVFIDKAKTFGGGLAACSSTANQTAYAVVVQLRSDLTKAWCVDNTGDSKEVTLATANQAGVTAEINASGQCVE